MLRWESSLRECWEEAKEGKQGCLGVWLAATARLASPLSRCLCLWPVHLCVGGGGVGSVNMVRPRVRVFGAAALLRCLDMQRE